MELGDGAHEAQTQAVARRAAASLEADEAIEEGVAAVGGNAGTGIRHLEADQIAGAPDTEGHAALGRVFEGVVEKIRHRLRKEMAVALNGDPRLRFDGERQA